MIKDWMETSTCSPTSSSQLCYVNHMVSDPCLHVRVRSDLSIFLKDTWMHTWSLDWKRVIVSMVSDPCYVNHMVVLSTPMAANGDHDEGDEETEQAEEVKERASRQQLGGRDDDPGRSSKGG
jgi:hypothetical protein